MGKNKKGKAGANKAEKNAGGEDSEPLVSKDEENDSQTEITSPDEVSTLDAQPAVTEAPQTTTPVPEPGQEESKVVKEEEIQPVIVETVCSTEEAVPETVSTAEPTGEAPAAETEPVTVVDQTQETEQPKDEQPKEEKPKEDKPKEEKPKEEQPAEEHHERTYAEVVASNIPEERDSLNEDHPLMGDSKSTTTAAATKPAQPAPEFDETSELTVEPVTSAEATSAPVAVAKEAPKESPKEESSFFTCLSSFKFW